MTSYPTPSDYQEVLQAPEVAFSDPELQAASPRTNPLGLPQPITGSFAAVFSVVTDAGVQYAVKCFLTEVPDQQARYDAVAEALDVIEHEALIDFEYQPDGIRVQGEAYPLLKMEWVEGTTLNRFVADSLDRPDRLKRLAEAWADLMDDLDSMDFAHGDLQHGNVLVETVGESFRLRLVDYDTLYVPALEGWSSAEVGHRNYQHPDRTDADFGPMLDRFAGIVIFTALRTCAARPDLWGTYDTGENLLFRDADFYAPEESPLFDDLVEIDAVADVAEALQTLCYVDPTDVPPLKKIREGDLLPSAGSTSRRQSQHGRGGEARSPFARAALPVVGGVGAICGGLAIIGWPLAALTLLLVGIGAGIGSAGARYRRLSVVRRRTRLEHEAGRFTAAIRELRREIESLTEKRDNLRTSIEEQRADRLQEVQDAALYDCLKHHFVGEVRGREGLTHKHVVRLKAAGIRTASEATPDALDSVRRISDRARAKLKKWRSDLEEEYADEIPDALTPAQERRLQRYIEHRVEELDAQLARTREKIEVQQVERERVQDRLDEMPDLTFGRYLRYLFRLATLPARPPSPPSPTPLEDANRQRDRGAVPDRIDDDQSWWTRSV